MPLGESNSSFSAALSAVTSTKAKDLETKKRLFQAKKANIYEQLKIRDSRNSREHLNILAKGVARLRGFPKDVPEEEEDDDDEEDNEEDDNDKGALTSYDARVKHIRAKNFLKQHKYDPSFSDEIVQRLIQTLDHDIELTDMKNNHALFFSQLVDEWLNELSEEEKKTDNNEFSGRQEMYDQRATWESIVFSQEDDPVSSDSINEYLNKLFFGENTLRVTQQAMQKMRKSVQNQSVKMESQLDISLNNLRAIAEAVLESGQLSQDKRSTLKAFMNDNQVLQEICDVLNMRLANLDNWDWSLDVIPLEMRRQLNGKYRVYMDIELLDALFLEYIGRIWSQFFKSNLKTHFSWLNNKNVWSEPQEEEEEEETRCRPKANDILRRRFYLRRGKTANSLTNIRLRDYFTYYFMSMLPDNVYEDVEDYNNESSDNQQQQNPHSTIIHLMETEAIFHTTIHNEFSVLRSDFQWFGPSLSHEAITTVLSFFGVSKLWINLFLKFLKAPVQFVGDDDSFKRRARGVPMNFILSSLFGEIILFCLDYSINQFNKGNTTLYRLHDDFWIWGKNDFVTRAWGIVQNFNKIFGLQINEQKTGSVQLCDHPILSSDLPKGDVNWGLLRFDQNRSKFVINTKLVDEHIKEFKIQLNSRKSILSWVKAYNSYMGYFLRNFGVPAVCLGKEHIDMILETLSRVERELFPEAGSCIGYLRNWIQTIYAKDGLPDAFFYFPSEYGGLGILNPYIQLLCARDDLGSSMQARIEKVITEEKIEYENNKKEFETTGGCNSVLREIRENGNVIPHPDQFMPFEEFTRFREDCSGSFSKLYLQLMEIPKKDANPWMDDSEKYSDSISSTELKNTLYWEWIESLYGYEVFQKFGSLRMIENGTAPLGVLNVLKSDKVNWAK